MAGINMLHVVLKAEDPDLNGQEVTIFRIGPEQCLVSLHGNERVSFWWPTRDLVIEEMNADSVSGISEEKQS